jgi:hypothetical protein
MTFAEAVAEDEPLGNNKPLLSSISNQSPFTCNFTNPVSRSFFNLLVNSSAKMPKSAPNLCLTTSDNN